MANQKLAQNRGPHQTWVSLPDGAQRLGVTWPEVITLIREGKLEGKLVSRARWFIDRASLERYARERGT